MSVRGLLSKDLKLLKIWMISTLVVLSILLIFVVYVKDKIPELLKNIGVEAPENVFGMFASWEAYIFSQWFAKNYVQFGGLLFALMGFFAARAELSGEGEFVASLPIHRALVPLAKSLALLLASFFISLGCFGVLMISLGVMGALKEVGMIKLFAASMASTVGLWGFSLLGASLSVLGIPGVIIAVVSSQALALLPTAPGEYAMWASMAVVLSTFLLVSARDRWPYVYPAFLLLIACIFAPWAKVHPSPAMVFISQVTDIRSFALSFISSSLVSVATCALYVNSFIRREW